MIWKLGAGVVLGLCWLCWGAVRKELSGWMVDGEVVRLVVSRGWAENRREQKMREEGLLRKDREGVGGNKKSRQRSENP